MATKKIKKGKIKEPPSIMKRETYFYCGLLVF
jgi:hypothetical protein